MKKMIWSRLLFSLTWSGLFLLAAPLPLPWEVSWKYLACLLGCSALLFVLATMLFGHRLIIEEENRQGSGRKRSYLFFGSVTGCLMVWSLYWYLFYPGLISWDIYVQWFEMAGKIPFSDWHSLFHTLLIRLLTRVWYSPGMLVLVQGLTTAILVGMAVLKLERLQVRRWIIYLVALFYSLFPLIGFLTISPMKDVAYAIACLWLTLVIAEIVLTGGKALEQKKMLVALTAALLFVALMRHNGIVPAYGTCVVLLIAYRKYYVRRLLLCTVVLLLLTAAYKGPVFTWLEVNTRDTNILKAHLPIMHIGAVLSHDGNITGDEKTFLSRVMPLSYWKKAYTPYSCMPLIFGKDDKGTPYLRGEFLKDEDNYKTFLSIWFRIAVRNIKIILLDFYPPATEFVWRITSAYPVFVFPNEDLEAQHLMSGYTPSQPLAEKVSPMARVLIRVIIDPATGWFFHRGGLLIFAMSFCLTGFLLYRSDFTIISIAAPIYLQIGTLILFPLVQDSRFIYPIVLTAPFIIALTTAQRARYPDA